jgi:hypothetical protein
MKKERRSEAVIRTVSQIDLAGTYLQLMHFRQMVEEAERLRAKRRPRCARSLLSRSSKAPRKVLQ